MATIILVLSTSLSIKWVGGDSPAPEKLKADLSIVTVQKPKVELPSVFKKIAWCESKNMQFNRDGSVHRGVQNPQDVGKYQINEHYHLEASRALGINIYTTEGNTEYAYRLYKANGTRDWNWSKWCWDDQSVSTSTWALRFKENL